MRRPPAKRRGPTRPTPATQTPEPLVEAPGHLGGNFEPAEYPASKWDGYFGFQPTPDQPIERARHARMRSTDG